MAQAGLRVTISTGQEDTQVRLQWEAWRDGRWERLAVQAEVDDATARSRLPSAIAEVVGLWLTFGDLQLLVMQEVPEQP